MSDSTQDRGPQDRSRVNVNQPHEVRYWTQEFNCTEQQLRDAVARVGVMANAVRTSLGLGGHA